MQLPWEYPQPTASAPETRGSPSQPSIPSAHTPFSPSAPQTHIPSAHQTHSPAALSPSSAQVSIPSAPQPLNPSAHLSIAPIEVSPSAPQPIGQPLPQHRTLGAEVLVVGSQGAEGLRLSRAEAKGVHGSEGFRAEEAEWLPSLGSEGRENLGTEGFKAPDSCSSLPSEGLRSWGADGPASLSSQGQKCLEPKTTEEVKSHDIRKRLSEAAHKVQRVYRFWKAGKVLVDRKNLCRRLKLEQDLLVGVARLCLFGTILMLLIAFTSVGSPTKERLQIREVLYETLQLEEFESIQTLEGLRDFLPELSTRIKPYAPASFQRFPDGNTVQLLSKRKRFDTPVLVYRDLPVSVLSFTIMAWVELPLLTRISGVVPLLRKPYSLNSEVSCWGFFTNPPQFRFGGQDFFGVDAMSTPPFPVAEAVVGVPGDSPALAHEAMVVDGDEVQFFRNGDPIGNRQRLPRPITDCFGNVLEMGAEDITLTSVKFYARALNSREIKEIVEGGSTLGELGTSSSLPIVTSGTTDEIGQMLDSQVQGVLKKLEKASLDASTASVVQGSKPDTSEATQSTVLIPPDPSPNSALHLGPSGMDRLPVEERSRWLNGGASVELPLVEKWQDDSNGLGPYWHVFRDPIYAHKMGPKKFSTLPEFQEDMSAVTVTMWVRALVPRGSALESPGSFGLAFIDDGDSALYPNLFQDVVTVGNRGFFVYSGISRYGSGFLWDSVFVHDCEMNLYRYEETKSLSEHYGHSSIFNSETNPVSWRFVTFTLDHDEEAFRIYIDGRLAYDTRSGGRCSAWHETAYADNNHQGVVFFPEGLRDARMSDLLSGLNLTFSNGAAGVPADFRQSTGVLTKVADLRIYPRSLTENELRRLHVESTWNTTEKAPMRECVDQILDPEFADSTDKDPHGNGCSWYFNNKLLYPHVCESDEARRRCPVACGGRKWCHDGSILSTFQLPPHKEFRIFDRIMHIKPKEKSILCRSDAVDSDAVLAVCRAGGIDPAVELHYRFNQAFSPNMLDLTNCTELELALADNQCEWNSDGLSELMEDYFETGSLSIHWWMKPVDSSKNIPFYPVLKFLSALAPVKYLTGIVFTIPSAMDMMWAGFASTHLTNLGWPFVYTAVYSFECCTDLEDWTMIYLQIDKVPGGGVRVCSSLNHMPLFENCGFSEGLDNVDQLLSAVELDREMLISPILFSTESRSASGVQKLYYNSLAHLQTIEGPKLAETDRQQAIEDGIVKESQRFDHLLLLVSPAVISQVRFVHVNCTRSSSLEVMRMQWELVSTLHCPDGSLSCTSMDGPQTVFTCRSESTLPGDLHFGVRSRLLDGETQFADFLSSVSDVDFLVRFGDVLDTREFLDSMTKSATIAIVFQSPQDGNLHYVKLVATLEGQKVETRVWLKHLTFLDEESKPRYLQYFVTCVLMIILVFVLNLFMVRYALKERISHPTSEVWRTTLLDCVYDLVQAVVLIPFAAISWSRAMGSEGRAESISRGLASVPWVDQSEELSTKLTLFFERINELGGLLGDDDEMQTFAIIVMNVMLLRMLKATEFHPRTGLLTGTFYHGLNDFWHFAILFALIFSFFAATATWTFGSTNSDFSDLREAMATQFRMLMGDLPDGFDQNVPIILYVSLTVTVIYFLAFNFLLAIVVEAYDRTRKDIIDNEVESEFFHDLFVSLFHFIRRLVRRWPSNHDLIPMLEGRITSRSVSAEHLRLAGVHPTAAQDIISSFSVHRSLSSKTQGSKPSLYLTPGNGTPKGDNSRPISYRNSTESGRGEEPYLGCSTPS